MSDKELQLSSVLSVETEREKEVCEQRKQADDAASRLQDELRQTGDRERQLQMQLGKMKTGVTQIQAAQQEFDNIEQCNGTKNRDSKIPVDSNIIVLV